MSDPVPCREQIVAAVFARLSAIDGVSCERNRRDPLDEQDLPSLILFEDDDEIDDPLFTGEDAYLLPICVQIALQGSGASVSTALNLKRAAVIAALRGDLTLAGIARNVTLADTGGWIGADINAPQFEGFLLAARVSYATLEGDPFTFA